MSVKRGCAFSAMVVLFVIAEFIGGIYKMIMDWLKNIEAQG